MADAAVHKYLGEIQDKVVSSSRQLAQANTQRTAAEREVKACALTLAELEPLAAANPPPRAFRAIGRAFVEAPLSTMVADVAATRDAAARDAEILEKAAAKLDRDIKDAQRAFREVVGKLNAVHQQQ